MAAYYNEIDLYAAQWLRNLIDKNLIAPGDVDTRSIEDVRPEELKQYTQCHFFAGIGIWSHALRQAGWSDDRPVWTGSCPCQPFSTAGKAGGFDDERHLWPAFHHLIKECNPPVVFGEQVASKDGLSWVDLVHLDLEGTGYASAAVDLCAAGVGAPHIRQRLYWVGERLADASSLRLDRGGVAETATLQGHRPERSGEHTEPGLDGELPGRPEGLCGAGFGLADASCQRRQQDTGSTPCDEATDGRTGRDWCQSDCDNEPAGNGEVCCRGLANANSDGLEAGYRIRPDGQEHDTEHGRGQSFTNGFWRDADWLTFRDGKIRPVEPGTFPLVDGYPGLVGQLRAYGNAINAKVAEEFIRAYLACKPD